MPMTVGNFGHLANRNIGYNAFIMPDFGAIKDATDYYSYRDSAPETRGAVTGGATGDMHEQVWGAYFELNGVTTIADRDLPINAGIPHAPTHQLVDQHPTGGPAFVELTSTPKTE